MKSSLLLASVLFAFSFSSFGQVSTSRAGLAQMTLERTMPTPIHDLKSEIHQFFHLRIRTNYDNYHPDNRPVYLEGIKFTCHAGMHWGVIETVVILVGGTPAQYGEMPSRPNASTWPSPESHAQPINDLRFVDADPAYTRRGHEGT